MRVFFDTNIILYSVILQNERKYAIASDLILRHTRAEEAVISTQILQETYNNTVKKFGWSAEEAETFVRGLLDLPVVGSSGPFVLDAVRIARASRIHIYDALMVAAAAEAGCETLYTEDLNHTQIISGVRIIDPFKDPP